MTDPFCPFSKLYDFHQARLIHTTASDEHGKDDRFRHLFNFWDFFPHFVFVCNHSSVTMVYTKHSAAQRFFVMTKWTFWLCFFVSHRHTFLPTERDILEQGETWGLTCFKTDFEKQSEVSLVLSCTFGPVKPTAPGHREQKTHNKSAEDCWCLSTLSSAILLRDQKPVAGCTFLEVRLEGNGTCHIAHSD